MSSCIVIKPGDALTGSPVFHTLQAPQIQHVVAQDYGFGLVAECGVTVGHAIAKVGFLSSGDSVCRRCADRRR
jgi:hypothetical protein